ncbi:glycosyltransferase [Paenibacillus sp.]|uniref:glycosyltransferase n=1 Tax=Paenibacillus sp. TaxID=58172 RepID=UPI002D41735A|nr:glycosyltransferase [Paenibacillus sp.]HZG84982.1 glycosyltransferase [Paenibacillus sp.]
MNHIIFGGSLDIRKGGSAGYLANLKVGLDNINATETTIISNQNTNTTKIPSGAKSRFSPQNLDSRVRDFYEAFFVFNYFRRQKHLDRLTSNITIKNEDKLHFHNIFDYYYSEKRFMSNKKYLTTHTPESIAIEYTNRLKGQHDTEYDFHIIKNKIRKIEKKVLQNCKNFIYPSKESLEPYYETIPDFDKFIDGKNIHFNMTGCKELKYKTDKKTFLKLNNIEEDAFIVSFVGRHNKVKGYDVFCEAFNRINKIDKKIIFISAGKGDIDSPSNKQFIDLGWTDDPGSLINASDVFVLPNNRTFFDLILLEVLSLGKAVIASKTGGNKTIAQLENTGLDLFEKGDIDELVKKLIHYKENKNKLDEMGKFNRELYLKYFTLEKFAERYQKILGT